MAPGTRLDPAKVVFNDEDSFHVNNNESAQNNPWPELIQEESANIQQDFSDSFSQGNFAASHNNNNDASFEKNDLYLQHLGKTIFFHSFVVSICSFFLTRTSIQIRF